MNMDPPHIDPAEFTVGWICALSIELAAAQNMLDYEYDKSHIHTQSFAGNDYTLGRIGNHNVVITCSPTAGITQATSTAIHMRYAFPKLRFGLMAGIGGGIPSKRNDIRLGDVVVSDTVIHYDSGKQKHDGRFINDHRLAPPPAVLLNAKNEVAARSEADGTRITRHLKAMYTKHPILEDKYGYPGQEHDRLFKPDYVHQGTDGTTCETCDPGYLIQRKKRSEHVLLEVHSGIIASGSTVMKDAVKRDELGEKHGALCVEMEAAGLMNNLPCLVIRGICDYADSHKNDDWHRYAAAAAAAYTKELLLNMLTSHVVDTPPAPTPSIEGMLFFISHFSYIIMQT